MTESSDVNEPPAGYRIVMEDLRERMERGAPVVIVDVRAEESYSEDPRRAKGAVRIPPDNAVETATRLAIPKGALLALYCT